MKTRPVYENLDTSYVNLAALLGYLRRRDFVGRVRVELEEYEAEVLFSVGGQKPRVREINHATGRQAEGDAALERLLVRATESGGLISVYEASEEGAAEDLSGDALASYETSYLVEGHNATGEDEVDWKLLLRTTGELIAAVERAALALGANFGSALRAARLLLADDYPFLDPSSGAFEYANTEVRLHSKPNAGAYVSGVAECLRRVVEKVAAGERASRVRERAALELAVLARRRRAQLEEFGLLAQLDRIAGTKVI